MSAPTHQRSAIATAWRFLVVGGTNTLATTAILVGLGYVLEGWIAYTIAFGLGLIYSTVFASRWVFTKAGSRRATMFFALCYVAIYLVGLGCVAMIRSLEWPHFLDALSVLVTAPLGFVVGRILFRERQLEEPIHND